MYLSQLKDDPFINHLDLKPENILIDENDNVKISGYGEYKMKE